MSLARNIFASPAKLWMNWPLWGGLLAVLLLSKHVWVLFAPAERAIPGTAVSTQTTQAGQLFGALNTATASASLDGIRPIGIFAHSKKGFAVMMTNNGQVGAGLGELVAPGIRLVETHTDHVILERNGMRHRVDLDKAPAAAGGVTPAVPTVRNMTVPPAGGQLLDQLTPEQQTILQQQQRDLIRGKH